MSDHPKDLTPVSNRRGRPKVAEPRISVCTRMDVKHYDQLVKVANEREQSVSSLLRDLIILRIPKSSQ